MICPCLILNCWCTIVQCTVHGLETVTVSAQGTMWYLQVFRFGQGERSLPIGHDGVLQHSPLAFAGSTNFEHLRGSTFPQILSICMATRNVVNMIYFQDEVQLSALAQDLVRLDKLSAAAWYPIKYTKQRVVNRVGLFSVSAHCSF